MTARRRVLPLAVIGVAALLAGCGGPPARVAVAVRPALPAAVPAAVPTAVPADVPTVPARAATPTPAPAARPVDGPLVDPDGAPDTGAGTAGTAGTPATPPRCRTPDVDLAPSDTQGGHTELTLLVHNGSSAPCTVSGFPRVRFGGGGTPLGAPASRRPGDVAAVLVLAPGGSARAALRVTSPGMYDDQFCVAEPVDALEVTVGAQPVSLALPGGTQACSDSRVDQLVVGTLTAA